MPEPSDQTSALDFLQSSELTARLRRRLASSPGVINIQDIFKIYARLTEWTTQTRLLLDELLARYSVDDGSMTQNLPLVTEHPWMLNLDTYLTNSNSFSSTTNNSYSVTTNEFVSQALSSLSSASGMSPSGSSSLSTPQGLAIESVSKHELTREVKTTELESKSSTRTSGKFRVSRKPGRISTETAAAGTTTANSADLQLATVAGQLSPVQRELGMSQPAQISTRENPAVEAVAARFTRKEEPGTAGAKNAASIVATPADLLLASRTRAPKPAQSELSGHDLNTWPTVSKDREDKLRPGDQESTSSQSIFAKPIFAPLNRPAETTNLTLNKFPRVPRQRTDLSWLATVQEQRISADLQEQQADLFRPGNADHRRAATQPRSLPPAVNGAGASFQTGQRPADFVWLRNRAEQTARELMAAVSDISSLQTAPRAARGISTIPSSPNNQTVRPESARRSDRQEEGLEITAEKILRRISNTLLVERERRGY